MDDGEGHGDATSADATRMSKARLFISPELVELVFAALRRIANVVEAGLANGRRRRYT